MTHKTTGTVQDAIQAYLQSVQQARSENTARTYRNAMATFMDALAAHDVLPTSRVDALSENAIAWLAARLKHYSPASERLYLTAATGFFEYLAAEGLAQINLPRLRLLIRQRARRPGPRLPQFPRNQIAMVIKYVNNLASLPVKDENETMRNLRDRAFLLTLADTGLRVHEACSLRRGDLEIHEQRALIIGKGNRQDVVRFSQRSIAAIKAYLAARSTLDGASRKPLASLPIFARHDRGAGKRILPITTTTGRNIVAERVAEALGPDQVGAITPHSFRHYFVTAALIGSGGNLKLAQELARHRNIAVTQRYAHLSDDELDRSYHDIFDETG